jgi:hypothetical protein
MIVTTGTSAVLATGMTATGMSSARMTAARMTTAGTSAASMSCSRASAVRVNMTLALKTGVVKTPSVVIASVFSFKSGVIMLEIYPVAVMPVPRGIGIIGIPGVIRFIDHGSRNSDAYIYMDL